MHKPMNLFRPVPNANKKQQFCPIVKILLFNERRKRWHMRKKKVKKHKENRKTPENGGRTGEKQKNGFFFSFDHVAGHLLLGYPWSKSILVFFYFEPKKCFRVPTPWGLYGVEWDVRL